MEIHVKNYSISIFSLLRDFQ